MLKRWLGDFKLSRKAMLLMAVFFLILLFTRFYNIDRTARFTQDESSDLLHMHQYAVEKKITLVGPISNDNTKVFGSLTYYMLLPFVILGNYNPISPVYGTAFWGVLTALLLIAITWKVNPKYLGWVSVLILLWYPLVETSRWAWNPHYVTFWIALGVFAYLQEFKWHYFFSGMFLGLAFHNHYIAVVATAVFVGVVAFQAFKEEKWQQLISIVSGYILTFVPFVVFDLRHPPGLFLTKYLSGGQTPNTVPLTAELVVERILGNFSLVMGYISLPSLSWLVGICCIGLVILERKNLTRLLWLLPVGAQLIMGSLLTDLQTRYFLPALVFFFVWLILPRKGGAKFLANLVLAICIISSLITIIPNLTQTKVAPDIYSLRAASDIIATQIKSKNLRNANVAALASPDSDSLGAKYRDVLSIKNVGLKAPSEYDASEHLFVMSTSDIETVKQDGAVAMRIFSKANYAETFTIPDSEWKVYWFRYGE